MRVRGAKLLVSAFAAAAGGCTFLISFDEVPGEPDAVAPPPPPDGGALPDAAPPVDARDARDVNYAESAACQGKQDGLYCPGNQIVWDGAEHDLVKCQGGKVVNVRFCDTGVGCIRMRDGFPDQCDECATKTTGSYCGRDMPGWDPENQNQRVGCQAGYKNELELCANGCTSNGASSACK